MSPPIWPSLGRRGRTTVDNASRYEAVVRGEVIPAIEARHIPGFLSIDLMRRGVPEGFEFVTIMWFTDMGWVKSFVGQDYEVAQCRPQREPCSSISTPGPPTTRFWIGGNNPRSPAVEARKAPKYTSRTRSETGAGARLVPGISPGSGRSTAHPWLPFVARALRDCANRAQLVVELDQPS